MMYLFLLLYVFGAFVVHMNYMRTGKIQVNDVLMFLTSPFSMMSVLLVRVVSTFVDVDRVIYEKH